MATLSGQPKSLCVDPLNPQFFNANQLTRMHWQYLMARFDKRPGPRNMGWLVRVRLCKSNHSHLRMTLIWKRVTHAFSSLRGRSDPGCLRQCIVPPDCDPRIGV